MSDQTIHFAMLRLGLAFLVAPFVGVSVGALVTWMATSFGDISGLMYAVLMIFVGCLYAYPIALTLGIPAHLALVHFRKDSLKLYTLLGAALGALCFMIAASPIPSIDGYGRAVSEAIFGLTSGIVGAAVFWMLACFKIENSNAKRQ